MEYPISRQLLNAPKVVYSINLHVEVVGLLKLNIKIAAKNVSIQQRIICTFADVLSAANLSRVRFKLLTMLPFTLPKGRCRWCVGLGVRLSRLATFGYCSPAVYCSALDHRVLCRVRVVTLLLVAAVEKSEKRERWRIQGLPNFLATPII